MPILSNMSFVSVLFPLALILILGKSFEIICRRLNLPQVLGLLVAGILIGLIKYIPGQTLLDESGIAGINFISKIGVILIMFTAGLETDISKIKKTGLSSIVVTLLGVIFPIGFGFIVATLFNGGFGALGDRHVLLSNLCYGVILAATSVSVTVATLKEMNKLDSNVGAVISCAAIIDDIIGVIVLSLVIGLSGGASTGEAPYLATLFAKMTGTSPNNPLITILLTLLCFIFIFGIGLFIKKLFRFFDRRYEHHRRVPIFGIACAFAYAWVCEKVFGVADITGAFFCGLILSRDHERDYVERRSDILSYMIFTPVFFANVGISMSFDSIEGSFILFGIFYIIAGILGKVIGCGLGAKTTGFNLRDSLKIGIGMTARAEVALICVTKGIDAGLISPNISTFVVILIVLTSFVTPICLRLLYRKEIKESIFQNNAKIENV